METPIIHPEDQDFLAENNLLCRSAEYPGFLHVHKAMLGPGSLREYETESYERRQYPLVLVPELFESSACLRYLGFKTETAQKVWSQWQQSSQDHKNLRSVRDDALSYIDRTVGKKEDTFSMDDGLWHELLTHIGVNDDFRRNLMDPRYKAVRTVETCKYWVKYFFAHRCDTLVEIYRFSRERHARHPDVMEIVGRGPAASVLSMEQAKPGFVTLWTGESYNGTRGHALDDVAWQVRSWAGLKSTGRDFWTTQGLSFTTYRELALCSIGWHKKNDQNAGFCLVQVQVPRDTMRVLPGAEESEVCLRWNGGYLHDTTLFCRPPDGGGGLGYDPLAAAAAPRTSTEEGGAVADGDERGDGGETKGPSQNRRPLPPDSYSVSESALDRHVVAHIDSNDFFEIDRMWDTVDRTPTQ